MDNKTLSRKKAFMAMLTASLCWCFSSFFIKLCPFTAFQVVCFRGSLAAFFLTLYIYFVQKKHFVINKTVLAVSIFVCFKYIFFVTANKLTAAANAVAMYQSNIIFVLIAGCILNKEKPRGKDIAIIIATILGVSLFFFGKFSFSGFLGNMLALGAGLCTAVLFFMSPKFKSAEENLTSIILGNVLSAVIALFFIVGKPIEITPIAIGSILFLGLIQQAVAFILYSKAIRVLNPFTCSILASLEPILSPIVCFLFLQEAPGKFAAAGTVIVIGSIMLWSITDFKKADNN